MKILYAAGNRTGSLEQLRRFIGSIKNKKHNIRIAAYSKSIGNLFIDYNLDCLLNFSNPDGNITLNNNYSYYFNEIKRFSPELIISDLEVFTSIIGLELNKTVWQVSPILLYTGTDQSTKYKNKIHRDHAFIVNKTFSKKPYINFIINNSDKRFIYSHLCDVENSPAILDNYEWIRPEFLLHNGGCETIVPNGGTETELADSFYNEQFSYSKMDYKDIESIICSHYNEQFNIGKIITNKTILHKRSVNININDGVEFLAGKI